MEDEMMVSSAQNSMGRQKKTAVQNGTNRRTKIAIAWSGIAMVIVYFAVVGLWFATKSELVRWIWECMIIISAVVVMLVLVSILEGVPAGKTGWKIAAIAAMTCTMGITSHTHWPAVMGGTILPGLPLYDSLAWGLFMGLAFLFSATALPFGEMSRVRVTMAVSGSLCLLGLVGPISGYEPLWFIAVAGYGLGTPVVCGQMISQYKYGRGFYGLQNCTDKNKNVMKNVILMAAMLALTGCGDKHEDDATVRFYLSQPRDPKLVGWWVNAAPGDEHNIYYNSFNADGTTCMMVPLADGTLFRNPVCYWWAKDGVYHVFQRRDSWKYGSREYATRYEVRGDELWIDQPGAGWMVAEKRTAPRL